MYLEGMVWRRKSCKKGRWKREREASQNSRDELAIPKSSADGSKRENSGESTVVPSIRWYKIRKGIRKTERVRTHLEGCAELVQVDGL